MSTCPDTDLYSALADGEVPSPWKERLEKHLGSCAECRKKADRFATVSRHLAIAAPAFSAERLDESFTRLCARRNEAMAALATVSPFKPTAWTHQAIRLSVPAFAAVLAAAIFLPSMLLLGTVARIQGANVRDAQSLASLQTIPADIDSSMKALKNSSPVYSPDLPEYASSVAFVPDGQNQLFSLLGFARQYSDRQDLLSNSQIIIIKLPELTHFSGTTSQLLPAGNAIGTQAGFSR